MPGTVYSPSLAVVTKNTTSHLLKVKLEEYCKAVVSSGTMKSGRADHVQRKKKNSYGRLWKEHWKIRCLKESTHMLVYEGLISTPSICSQIKKENDSKATTAAEVRKRKLL